MSLHQHFRPEERAFVDRVLEWIDHAANRHQVKQTDFLDPRQAHILSALANRDPDVAWMLHGGAAHAERKRAVLAPHYYDLGQSEFGIAVLSISSNDQRFAKLKHGDVLGALLGLGIKREKLGDIYLHEDVCHCVAAEEITAFLHLHLQQVHRVDVQTETIAVDQLRSRSIDYSEMEFTVASMRLDGVLSDAVRMSRSKIVGPIKAGACKVNWKVEQNPAAELEEGDVISLKGFGRYRILELEGPTKKGRMRVKVGKYL